MSDYFHEMGWEPLRDGEQPDHYLHLARLLTDMNMFEELGVGQNLPPAASKAVVNALPEKTITEKNLQCPICLKEYELNYTAIELPCKHKFHKECIMPWLNKTNSCPLCRHELPTDDETYEAYRKEQHRRVQREKDLEALHNSMFN